MIRTLSVKIIFICLLLSPILSISQIHVLDGIDFTSDKYKLYFSHHYANGTEYMISPVPDFIIHDKQKLLEIQQKWIGDTASEIAECGYHYTIYVMKQDSAVGVLNVNLKCEQVIAYHIGHSCNFSGNPFENLTIDDTLFRENIHTYDIAEARILHEKISNTKGVLYLPEYKNQWQQFDGKFNFMMYARPNSTVDWTNIADTLDERFGATNQEMEIHPLSESRCSVYMYCNKDFYEQIAGKKFEWEKFFIEMPVDKWESWESEHKLFYFECYSEDKSLLKTLMEK